MNIKTIKIENTFIFKDNRTLKESFLSDSYKGTIATKDMSGFSVEKISFNSYKGTIATRLRKSFTTSTSCFNSYKGTIATD